MIDVILNKLAKKCQNNSQKITTAESCTGGLVAKLITDLSGSSQWFERGFVTYSNLAKEQMLGVNEQLILEFGAVSEQVAAAMARGALTHSEAQFSLSITGIAGPDGGTEAKPVGLVWFGWGYYNSESTSNEVVLMTKSQQFSGDREAVRTQSAVFALQTLLEIISDN
ncbi:MAG: nicotinamide-nucleotide amidohydrolase family protein [Gammaproteobacteria bacterium]|nr:nicotinamide-nucleotide amidohydrolase family protein [Gammaproteobacteria bacterium]